MVHVTEDTINDIIASYLRSKGFRISTQLSAKLYSGNKKPDFELSNGEILYGEGEWNSSYLKGMTQAIEYGDISGASGYFLLGYPDYLRKKLRSRQMELLNPEKIFGETEFRGLLKLKNSPSSIFRGKVEDICGWIEDTLSKKPKKIQMSMSELWAILFKNFLHILKKSPFISIPCSKTLYLQLLKEKAKK